jgi:hypothetical protein
MPSFRAAYAFVRRVTADLACFHDQHYTFSKTGSSIKTPQRASGSKISSGGKREADRRQRDRILARKISGGPIKRAFVVI